MKPLDKLNNMERGRLLHQLFPADIPGFIDFTLGVCQAVAEEKRHMSRSWQHPAINFSVFLQLAESVQSGILKYGQQLCDQSYLFGEQLFLGYRVYFMVYCLEQFTKTRKHPNPKFAQMAAILFDL